MTDRMDGRHLQSLLVLCLTMMTSLVAVTSSQEEAPETPTPGEAAKCPDPEPVKHAVYRLDVDTSTVDYECGPGFTLVGSQYSTCENGQWSSTPPFCLGQDCKPISVRHATLISSHAGGMVKCQCRRGFVLEGPEVLACVDGQWNGTEPHCVRRQDNRKFPRMAVVKPTADIADKSTDDGPKDDDIVRSKWSHVQWLEVADYSCIDAANSVTPPPVVNGRAFTQWALHGGQPRLYTTYQCNWGHVMRGTGKTTYCSRGQWVGTRPTCHLFAPSEEAELSVQGDSQSSGGELTHDQLIRRADFSCVGASAVDNIDPLVPDHSAAPIVKFAIVDGRPRLYAVYACAEGHVLVDANRKYMYCRDRMWIGHRPTCIAEAAAAAVDGCLMNNGGCEQQCNSDSAGTVSCACKDGFTLNSDAHTCQDVDECTVNSAGCEHACDNLEGGYECSCFPGFTLDENHVSCSRVPDDQ